MLRHHVNYWTGDFITLLLSKNVFIHSSNTSLLKIYFKLGPGQEAPGENRTLRPTSPQGQLLSSNEFIAPWRRPWHQHLSHFGCIAFEPLPMFMSLINSAVRPVPPFQLAPKPLLSVPLPPDVQIGPYRLSGRLAQLLCRISPCRLVNGVLFFLSMYLA